LSADGAIGGKFKAQGVLLPESCWSTKSPLLWVILMRTGQ
jgi:hypothetical protein